MLQAEVYDLSEEGKVPIKKNWSGREGLQFMQTLTNAEKEAFKSATWLFNVLKEKFRQQHNETILLLQYCKLQRKENESTKEWFGRLWIKEAECKYKEHDRQLNEQNKKLKIDNCKCCDSANSQKQYPAFGKTCSACR